MSRFKKLLAKVVVAAFLVTTIFSQSGFSIVGATTNASETSVKRIIVKYKDESKSDLVKDNTKNKLNLSKLSSKKKFKKGNLELLEVDANTNITKVLDELKNNSSVEFAQEDYQVILGSVANDTLYNEQWALKNNGQAINGVTGTSDKDLSAENAWDITKGNSDVVVAVLDTDLDINHEDLNQNIWVNTSETPNNGIDDDNNGYVDDISGFDFAKNSNVVDSSVDGQSHATHLAGIIAALSNNSKGVSGIAPNVKIMPLKFVGNGIGYTSDAIEAIQYAEANGATIANCSWWTSENNIALKDAISVSNMLFVTAAGNSGSNDDLAPVYPANFNLNNVISVAALDNQGNLASFSNYGVNSVDIAAPGKDIISTIPGNSYGYLSGTSMSTAYTSGVAALVKSQNPSMTASQIKEQINASAVSNSNISCKIKSGRVLNAYYTLGGQKTPTEENSPTENSTTTENDTITGNDANNTINTNGPPQDPDQYAIWKQNLSNAASADSQVSTLGYSNGKMYNDYIEYVVANGGSDNGRFTIGTTGGNPDNAYDNYKLMLFGHPSPWSSYTTFKLDETNYIYNPTTQYPTPNTTELSNTSEYKVGNVSVKQIVSIVKSTSTQRDDTVQIKYIVKNNDSVNHDAGLRIMMDTMLGSNDAAPFRLPGIGAVTTETELTGDSIPEYWQAFDSLTNPTVVSQGTLLRSLDNKPDKVQFTNWGRASSNPWMTSVSTGLSNGDSAVSVYWNPKALTPGETREYVTYYGLSEFQQDLRPPLAVSLTGANNIVATESGYNPNPFTVTTYIMNNGNAPANNVKATIDLPSGLRLAGRQQNEISLDTISPNEQERQVSWEIEIEPSSVDRNLTYSVVITADNTATKSLTRNIFIPASIEVNPIDNITIETTDSTATVNWSVPAGAGGTVAVSNIGGYYAYLPYDSGIAIAATSNVTKSLNFSGLSADTDYNYTIYASLNGRTYSKMGSFKTKSNKVVIIVPGIAGTGMSITHVHGATFPWQSDETVTHDVWLPGGLTDHDHNIHAIACNANGDSLNNITIKEPLDDYYGNMYRRLTREGFSVYYFGYDWRMGCDKNAEKLETYVNSLRNSLGVDKVNIIAHSMGGLVSSKYIANGNSDKVSKLITYGTPYLGAPKGLYVFETGNFTGNGINDFVAGGEFKEVSPNFLSAYMLLPNKKYFNSNYGNTYYVRAYYDNTWPKGNKTDNITSFNNTNSMINLRDWNNSTLLTRANSFNDSFDLINTLKSVDSYFFVGDQNSTIGKVELQYSENGYTNTYKDSGCKDIDPVNGDGTVPIISATIGNRLDDIHTSHTFYVNQDHGGLLNNTDVMDQTVSLLNNNNTIVNGSSLRRTRTDTNKLKLRIACPVDLHVYDSNSNHVGPISSNEYEQTIKASSYYTLGDIKIAFLNKDIYNVKLLGTGNGKMTYTLQEYDYNDNLTKTIRFDNVEITPQTVITTNTDIDGEIKLNIDSDNNGIIDSSLTPSVILDAEESNDIVPPIVGLEILGQTGQNGWYNSDVDVKVNATDENSGINRIEYSLNSSDIKPYDGVKIPLTNEGLNNLYVNATDNNGSTCDAIFKEIMIDKSLPVISLNVEDKQEFLLNEVYNVKWSSDDTVSGISSTTSSVPNDSVLDTSSVGAKTINIIATDNAGNKMVKTITYYVRYSYSGICQPINEDGSSVLKIGSTVPVKFKLKDVNGSFVSEAVAKLTLEKIIDGVQGSDIDATSTSAATTGNLFRCSDNQYIFNLNTKSLSAGTWKLKIVLNDGTTKEVLILLKSK